MSYVAKLEDWFQKEKAAGRIRGIKFFPGVDLEGSMEELAKAAYQTLTGEVEVKPLDTSDL